MKAYRLNPPGNGQARYERTQADAKRVAKELDASFEQVEIPTDQQGLVIYLNDLAAEQRSLGRQAGARQVEAPALDAAGKIDIPRATHRSQESFTTDEIEDFILNRATTAQTENIFACLGTRFAELAARKVMAAA